MQFLEKVENLTTGLRVKRTGRLVGEQKRRIAGERSRNRDALLLTARELVRHVSRLVAEPHALQLLQGALFSLVARHMRVEERELHILEEV